MSSSIASRASPVVTLTLAKFWSEISICFGPLFLICHLGFLIILG
jgi:hypothetical protein